MLKKFRARLTPAVSALTIAGLVVVGGSTAVAAKAMIDGRDIAKNSISAGKLTDRARTTLAGAEGPAGPQGPAGATGAQGPKGDPGATGPAGPQGNTGAPGQNGQDGEDGEDGVSGSKVLVGGIDLADCTAVWKSPGVTVGTYDTHCVISWTGLSGMSSPVVSGMRVTMLASSTDGTGSIRVVADPDHPVAPYNFPTFIIAGGGVLTTS